jgi:hypothetical protein
LGLTGVILDAALVESGPDDFLFLLVDDGGTRTLVSLNAEQPATVVDTVIVDPLAEAVAVSADGTAFFVTLHGITSLGFCSPAAADALGICASPNIVNIGTGIERDLLAAGDTVVALTSGDLIAYALSGAQPMTDPLGTDVSRVLALDEDELAVERMDGAVEILGRNDLEWTSTTVLPANDGVESAAFGLDAVALGHPTDALCGDNVGAVTVQTTGPGSEGLPPLVHPYEPNSPARFGGGVALSLGKLDAEVYLFVAGPGFSAIEGFRLDRKRGPEPLFVYNDAVGLDLTEERARFTATGSHVLGFTQSNERLVLIRFDGF